MRSKGKFVVCALGAGVALGSMVQAAGAACGPTMAGVWHFHALEVGKDVGDGSVIRCVASVISNGNFTAPCVIYEAGSGTPKSKTVSGKLMLTATCDLTGSVTIPGDKSVTIRFGHVNGNIGSGVATQNTGLNTQVLHFNLVRK